MHEGRSARAISPVVGVVLLVAVVVVLAGLSVSLVFGLTEEQDPAPDAVLQLEPTEQPVAHEFRVSDGDSLYGEKVEFRGTADETPVTGRLAAGERLTVYPVAETVEVVWFGEHDSSYVLATFEPETSLPEVDEDCNWVDSETTDGTDSVSIDVVVNCNVITEGDVDVVDPGVVIGDVDSEMNTVDIDDGAVYGTIDSKSAVDLDASRVASDVTAGGDVTVTGETRVDGGLTATGSGSVDVDADSTVTGSVEAGDDVALDSATVGGDVEGPDVDLDDTTVGGDILGSDKVQLDGVTVDGDVYTPSGSFTCTDSTINGQDCASYTPKDPDDY